MRRERVISVHGVRHAFLKAPAAPASFPPRPLDRDRARLRTLGGGGQFWVRGGSREFQPSTGWPPTQRHVNDQCGSRNGKVVSGRERRTWFASRGFPRRRRTPLNAGSVALCGGGHGDQCHCVQPSGTAAHSCMGGLLGDPADIEFGEQFDAIVGRFVLMYYPDPVDAIRKLARHLRPMGLMVFQEFDMTNMRSFPACRTFEMATDLIKQAFNASGARTNMGLELNSTFVDA